MWKCKWVEQDNEPIEFNFLVNRTQSLVFFSKLGLTQSMTTLKLDPKRTGR